MKLSIKNLLETNLSLKIVSLLFGVSFWAIFTTWHNSSLTTQVPICFYGSNEKRIVDSPETVTVELSGKRSDLLNLDLENLAVHVNSDELIAGENLIELSHEKLFLPCGVKLVHYFPSNPIITITDKEIIA